MTDRQTDHRTDMKAHGKFHYQEESYTASTPSNVYIFKLWEINHYHFSRDIDHQSAPQSAFFDYIEGIQKYDTSKAYKVFNIVC